MKSYTDFLKNSFHNCYVYLFLVITVIAVSSSFSQDANSSEEKVVLKSMLGRVEIHSPESGKWRPARPGMTMKMGWDLRTFVESEAVLGFETGTVLKIGENSTVTLSSILINKSHGGTTKTKVDIATGEVWGNVKKLVNNRSEFLFETPTATAAIRGTRLGIRYQKGLMRLDVYEGAVLMRKRGSRNTSTVLADMRAVAEDGKDDVQLYDMNKDSSGNSGNDSSGSEPMVDPFVQDSIILDSTQDSSASDTGSTLNADSVVVPDSALVDSAAQVDSTEQTLNTDSLGIIDSSLALDTIKTVETDSSAETDADTADSSQDQSLQVIPLEILNPGDGQVVVSSDVVLSGRTVSGADVTVAGVEAAVGSDGGFSLMIALSKGPNAITVKAVLGNKTVQKNISIVYRPPVGITVNNASDNMEIASMEFDLDIDVTEGAQFSVNQVSGNTLVNLKPGSNIINIKAWDSYGGTAEKSLTLICRTKTDAALFLSSPSNGTVVKEPKILVSGTVTPGANLTVNGVGVQVSSSGTFSYSLNLPDEAGEYDVSVVAEIAGDEVFAERSVVYTPPRPPLILEIASPVNGQSINRKTINVSGRTSIGAEVTVNDVSVKPSSTGSFSADISIQETDIGSYPIEFIAANEDEEIVKNVTVNVNIASLQVNTGKPSIQVQGQLSGATRKGVVSVSAVDRTPNDVITVTVMNNGAKEEYSLESGQSQDFDLEEGKNVFTVTAKDLAGNASNAVSGSVYYLPGPLTIRMVQPQGSVYVIKGLPPMPGFAGTIDKPMVDVEVEIDDRIGSVPEAIRFCRVQGNGQTILLRDNKDYSFSGEVVLERGKSNVFTITAEDLAGNTQTTTLTVQVSR